MTGDEKFLRDFRATASEYVEHREEYSTEGQLNLAVVLGERSPRLLGIYDATVASAADDRRMLAALEAQVSALTAALAISLDDVGRIMHESWTRTKRAQGFHGAHDNCLPPKYPPVYCYGIPSDEYPFGAGTSLRCPKFHPDLIPWEELPQNQKDINLHAFDDVLAEINQRAGHPDTLVAEQEKEQHDGDGGGLQP